MKNKRFDCIAFQDQEALRIHEELKGKTREEVLAYFHKLNEEARKAFPQMREERKYSSS